LKYYSKKKATENNLRTPPDLFGADGDSNSVAGEFKTAVAGGTAPDERQHDADSLVVFALNLDDPVAVAQALKAIELLLPLDPGQEKALDQRTLALIADGTAQNYPALAEAIAAFVFRRARNNASIARPYIPALLSFLDYDISTTGASSYYTLIIVTRSRPEDLQPYASTLIAMLDSPRDATKAFAIKIIAALAREHPEYVAGAEKKLESLSSSHPQPIVRKISADAYHVLHHNLSRDDTDGQVEGRPGGLQIIPANTGDTGHRPSISEEPDHRSMSQIGSGINAVIARVLDKVDELINLKMYVNLSIIGRASDNEEMREVLGHFSEIAPWVKEEFRSPKETAEAVELPPSPDATTTVTLSDTLTKKMVQDAFRKDTFKFALPIEAATTIADTNQVLTVQALDQTQVAELQRIMKEVEQDFSISASTILSTIGLDHLNPESSLTAEGGNRQISAKEFVAAIEMIIKEQDCNRQKHGKPQELRCADGSEEQILDEL
jgi:hypothetical protein